MMLNLDFFGASLYFQIFGLSGSWGGGNASLKQQCFFFPGMLRLLF
jgi:hypothetical protein